MRSSSRSHLRAFFLGDLPPDEADALAVELLLDERLFDLAVLEEEAMLDDLLGRARTESRPLSAPKSTDKR